MSSQVAIFCSSPGKNLELSRAISEEVQSQGGTPWLVDLTELTLPLYSSVEEGKGIPEEAKSLTEKLKASSKVVFIAPEYNGGLPPNITNFIAWVSRSGDDNWREAFNGKKALIGTHSGSGGLHALMALRIQLSYVGMNVLGRQIHTHYKRPMNPETIKDTVAQLLKD